MVPPQSIILHASAISCSRSLSREERSCIRDLSVAIEEHTLCLVRGVEGCGKNLLIRLLGLLERPDEGRIYWRGATTQGLVESELAAVRNRHFGFLFGAPFLLPSLSVIENVAMPLFKVSGPEPEEAQQRTMELLDRVGLAEYGDREISELSLEEQHRVALARALANEPEILIVEDFESAQDFDPTAFAKLLKGVQGDGKLTVIASASRDGFTPAADRVITMQNGRIRDDSHPVPFGGGGWV